MSNNKSKRRVLNFILPILLIIIAVLFIAPTWVVFINSIKPLGEILKGPFSYPKEISFDSLKYVFSSMNFFQAFFNTLFIAIIVNVITVVISAMCGYKLTRSNDTKSKILLFILISSMIVPVQSFMIPISILAGKLNISNTRIGYIMILIPLYAPFATFMYSSFIKTIPIELEEAATIDGCSRIRMFFKIIFPLLKPTTASIVVLYSLWVWNDFTLPMILLHNESMKTITLTVYSFFSAHFTRWDYALAALSISVIPMVIFFAFMQKYFIAGITSGAVKG